MNEMGDRNEMISMFGDTHGILNLLASKKMVIFSNILVVVKLFIS